MGLSGEYGSPRASRLGTSCVVGIFRGRRSDLLVQRSRRRRVCKLLDRICDPTPDRHTCVIALRRKLLGEPNALGYSSVAVSLEHQVCGTPDVDFGYHTGEVSRACLAKLLTGREFTEHRRGAALRSVRSRSEKSRRRHCTRPSTVFMPHWPRQADFVGTPLRSRWASISDPSPNSRCLISRLRSAPGERFRGPFEDHPSDGGHTQ